MSDVNESVIGSLGLQIGQLSIDKAFAEARLQSLLGLVKEMLMTTQWSEDDNGCKLIAPATEPFVRLHAAVLSPAVPASYAPGVVHQEVHDPSA